MNGSHRRGHLSSISPRQSIALDLAGLALGWNLGLWGAVSGTENKGGVVVAKVGSGGVCVCLPSWPHHAGALGEAATNAVVLRGDAELPLPGRGCLPVSRPAQYQQALLMTSLDVGRGPASSHHTPWIMQSDPPDGLWSCSSPGRLGLAFFFLPFVAAPSCQGEKKDLCCYPHREARKQLLLTLLWPGLTADAWLG